MTGYLLTDLDRQKAQSEETRQKRAETIAERRRYQREDVLLLRGRGMVPLAIADELGLSLRRVVDFLGEAGEEIPGYLFTWNAPPREHKTCSHCGRELRET